MLKRFLALTFVGLLAGLSFVESSGARVQQGMAPFRNNSCVQCHSRISRSLAISNRYLDWHLSAHKIAGIGCEKCHGGDPASRDQSKAHQGVLPSSDSRSRLYQANVPETCGTCHQPIFNAFVGSAHYKKLKESGLGPSCNSCHRHMASAVITSPAEGTTLCTFCHNSINGLLPPKPEISRNAGLVLESFARADQVMVWVNDLLEEAAAKKVDVSREREDLRHTQGLLKEAKTGWHSFDLESARTKADKAFEEGVRIKEGLTKKLSTS
jgi:cytochrome c554/c'-like protein